MARDKFYPTGTQRFFYKINKDNQKVYVAKFEHNKKSIKRVLSTDKEQSYKMLLLLVEEIKENDKKESKSLSSKILSEKISLGPTTPTSSCITILTSSSSQNGSKTLVSSFKNNNNSPEEDFTARLFILEKLKFSE